MGRGRAPDQQEGRAHAFHDPGHQRMDRADRGDDGGRGEGPRRSPRRQKENRDQPERQPPHRHLLFDLL